MPTEQNVDVFVDRLVRAGLLLFDPLVDEIRHGERPRTLSERTTQIRFRRAVGISRRKLVSIEQAQQAAQHLAAGDRSPTRSRSAATTTSRSSRARCGGRPVTPQAS
jgi:hypothetical protein